MRPQQLARRRRRVIGLASTLGLAVVLVACTSSGSDGATTTTAPKKPTAATTTTLSGSNLIPSGGSTPSEVPPTVTHPLPTVPPKGSKPVIESFATSGEVDCSAGGKQQFTASWSTGAAYKVTLSIDGKDSGKSYPAVGTATLAYACNGPHTYLLTATGSAGTTTRSVVIRRRPADTASTDN
jgi:hypothetical protein